MNPIQKHDVVNFRLSCLMMVALLAMVAVAGFGPIGCMAPSSGPQQTASTAEVEPSGPQQTVATAEAGQESVRVWTDRVTLPTHAVHPDPVPRFQATDHVRYYPYSSQRDIAPDVEPKSWTAVYMENRYLKVMVMPELGGRVFTIYDKLAKRDIIYRQTSIKPARVGIRGAWISGGIEYDFPDSHSVTTHDKVHWATKQYEDGSAAILIGDVERVSRMGWTVEFRLAPDHAAMEDRIYLHNRTPMRQRYYYWTNAGVEATEQTQMILPFPKVTGHSGGGLEDWPIRDGEDWSWFWKYRNASSVFGIGGQESFIGAYYHDKGVGVAHYADRKELPGRKFWTWGTSPAGMRWYDVLSDDNRPYAELQAGPMLTQSLYAWMQPYESHRYTEYWLPISRIGPFARVNPDAAVRLTADTDGATVGVLPMRTFSGAQVDLCVGDRVVRTWKSDLAPEWPLLETVDVDPADAKSLRLVVRDAHGRTVIEHTIDTYDIGGDVPEQVPTMESVEQDTSTPAGAAKRYELYWLDKRYTDAGRTIEEAVSKWPDDSHVRFSAGVYRLFQGRPADAVELLEPVVAAGYASPQAAYYLALAKVRVGALDAASRLLADVRTITGEGSDVATWKRAAQMLDAKVLLLAGRFGEARTRLEAILKSDAEYPYGAALCVYAARREGRPDVATRLMQDYLQKPDLDPMARLEVQQLTGQRDATLERMLGRDADVSIELACDYLSIGDWAMAEAILTGQHGENTKSGMTWLMAAWCAAHRGQTDKASDYRGRAEDCPVTMVFPSRVEELAAAEDALRAKPASSRAAYYAGMVLMRLMRYDEAVEQWRQAIRAKDDNALAERCLAMALSVVKQDQRAAIEPLRRAIAIDPRQPVFYQDLADLYHGLRQQTDARDVLAQAMQNASVTDELVGNMAVAYLGTGQYVEATEALAGHQFNVAEGRYGVHDDYAAAWVGQGLQALQRDDLQAALAAFGKALDYPENLAIGRPAEPRDESMIHFWRGVTLRQLGRAEQAKQAFEMSVEQAGEGRRWWRDFYGTINAAHGVLALRALGKEQEAASRIEQLATAPERSRWMTQEEHEALTSLRGAWAHAVPSARHADAAAFGALMKDPAVPAEWITLSSLAAETLLHCEAFMGEGQTR